MPTPSLPPLSSSGGDRWERAPDVFAERTRIRNPKAILHHGVQADQDAHAVLNLDGRWTLLEPGWTTLDSVLDRLFPEDGKGDFAEVTWITKAALPVRFQFRLTAARGFPDCEAKLSVMLGLADAEKFIAQLMPARVQRFTEADFAKRFEDVLAGAMQGFLGDLGLERYLALAGGDEVRDRLDGHLGRLLGRTFGKCGLVMHGVDASSFSGVELERLMQKQARGAVAAQEAKLDAETLHGQLPHQKSVHAAQLARERDELENQAEHLAATIPHHASLAEAQDALADIKHRQKLRAQEREAELRLASVKAAEDAKAAQLGSIIKAGNDALPGLIQAAIKATMPPAPASAPSTPPVPLSRPLWESRDEQDRSVGLIAVRVPGTLRLLQGLGTAWACGPQTLATCAHVVEAMEAKWREGCEIVFALSRSKAGAAVLVPRGRAWKHRLHGAHPLCPHGAGELVVPPYDVALIGLDGNPGLVALPRAGVSHGLADLAKNTPVRYCGFPYESVPGGVNLERPEADQQPGEILALRDWWNGWTDDPMQRLLIRHNVAATGGASGSPLFTQDGRVVGIISAATMHEMKFRVLMRSPDQSDQMVVDETLQVEPNLKRWPSAAMTNFAMRVDLLDDVLRPS